MLQSPELQAKIATYRQRQKEGTMTLDDWKQVFQDIRADRSSAQAASTASKTKKQPKAPARSAATLLGGLKQLAALTPKK